MQLHQSTSLRAKAFSLIEMLVVIAVIGIVASIAIPSMSDVNGSAKTARDQRNAQNLCSMYNGAIVAGVDFASNTTEGILDELIAGKTGETSGITFQLSPLNEEAREGLIAYCVLDESGNMRYSSEPVEQLSEPEILPEPPPVPPSDWVNFQPIVNGWVAGRISDLQVHFPEREWRWIPLDHAHAMIQFRIP